MLTEDMLTEDMLTDEMVTGERLIDEVLVAHQFSLFKAAVVLANDCGNCF